MEKVMYLVTIIIMIKMFQKKKKYVKVIIALVLKEAFAINIVDVMRKSVRSGNLSEILAVFINFL